MKNRTMTINIPSYKRSDAQMSTLRLFPHARLWVASFEYEKYKKNFPGVEIVKMPDSAQGLWSRARNYLLDHIDSDYFYIMDDDIQQIVYMTGNKLFPIKEDGEYTNRKLNNMIIMHENFKKCMEADDLQNFNGTAYKAVNAFSDMIFHGMATMRHTKNEKENNLLSVINGNQLFDKAVALIKDCA